MPRRPETPQEAMRGFLMGADPGLARFRRLMRNLPSSPHCKFCAAPFEGPAGAVLRHVGFARFPGNPAICGSCIKSLNKLGVYGAEIPASLLFADIRGSTTIGEQTTPTEFRAFLDRFYRLSSNVILENDGIVDKFVGDEVIGLFFNAVSGTRHPAAAIAAARALLIAAGRPDASGRGPIPLGAAVHTGEAFVGSTGADGAVNDFTALGDVVNTTARLAGEAGAGEVLVSVQAATAASLDLAGLERRTLTVRGRTDSVEVVVLRPEGESVLAAAPGR
jgi:adenylate cyclase